MDELAKCISHSPNVPCILWVEGQPLRVKAEGEGNEKNTDSNIRYQYRWLLAAESEFVPDVVMAAEVGGKAMYLMEVIRGLSMHHYLMGGMAFMPMDVQTASAEAEKALTAVHGKGLAHNDFVPSNIIIREGSRRLVLIDPDEVQDVPLEEAKADDRMYLWALRGLLKCGDGSKLYREYRGINPGLMQVLREREITPERRATLEYFARLDGPED